MVGVHETQEYTKMPYTELLIVKGQFFHTLSLTKQGKFGWGVNVENGNVGCFMSLNSKIELLLDIANIRNPTKH